ncbi:unnamed protein product [Notodromas monacha]|uniref:Uncharacterized protein n=1 Tax=Notodromas monacha TaxID=399045 RepID=A0A7R9GIB1_9CRUS|nr:unnamed protein product [Notodromas monacha]CAG0921589.1 unnamed protein product [Notodromas monacha]
MSQEQEDLIVLLRESAHHLAEAVILFNNTLDSMVNATIHNDTRAKRSPKDASDGTSSSSSEELEEEKAIYNAGVQKIAKNPVGHMVEPKSAEKVVRRRNKREDHHGEPFEFSFLSNVLNLMGDNVKQMHDLVKLFNSTVKNGKPRQKRQAFMPSVGLGAIEKLMDGLNMAAGGGMMNPTEREKENIRRGYKDALAQVGRIVPRETNPAPAPRLPADNRVESEEPTDGETRRRRPTGRPASRRRSKSDSRMRQQRRNRTQRRHQNRSSRRYSDNRDQQEEENRPRRKKYRGDDEEEGGNAGEEDEGPAVEEDEGTDGETGRDRLRSRK